MTSDERWAKAQEYERSHWQGVAQEMAAQQGSLEWYKWRADTLREKLHNLVPDLDVKQASVLEIGSGPVGTASYLPALRRCAIDPLMDFYESNPALLKWRSDGVEYMQGGGESLSFPDGSFELVIIENVIDHTREPMEVLREIRRVLKPGGYLYLTVNVRTAWGLRVRQLMEMFEIDRGHPYSYSSASARKLIAGSGLRIVHEQTEDFKLARAKEKKAGHLRSRVKILLGVYDVLYETVACKE